MVAPLKFKPILKSVVWGGEKIAPFKGIATDQKHIGESWEISGVPGNESIVADGSDAGMTLSEMTAKYKGALVGEANYARFGTKFPLLIKIIDAAGNLSLQVHPDDNLAMKRHNSLGKTEMWYIIDTEPGATICAGLAKALTPDGYVKAVADNTLMDYVAHHQSNPGDVFFLPAGRIHAIGAGNLLVEVQETSDITYRIYDYGRVDAATGKTRELHVDQAKDAIDYTVYSDYVTEPTPAVDGKSELVKCDHFTVDLLSIDGSHAMSLPGTSFTTLTCIEGDLKLDWSSPCGSGTATIAKGESMLVPAAVTGIAFTGSGRLVTATN